MAYVLVLGAHVELPELVPFALFLLAAALVTAALVGALRGAAPRLAPVTECVPAGSFCTHRRATRPLPESKELEAMRAALARLEGELYALEDQRLTELARTHEGAG